MLSNRLMFLGISSSSEATVATEVSARTSFSSPSDAVDTNKCVNRSDLSSVGVEEARWEDAAARWAEARWEAATDSTATEDMAASVEGRTVNKSASLPAKLLHPNLSQFLSLSQFLRLSEFRIPFRFQIRFPTRFQIRFQILSQCLSQCVHLLCTSIRFLPLTATRFHKR